MTVALTNPLNQLKFGLGTPVSPGRQTQPLCRGTVYSLSTTCGPCRLCSGRTAMALRPHELFASDRCQTIIMRLGLIQWALPGVNESYSSCWHSTWVYPAHTRLQNSFVTEFRGPLKKKKKKLKWFLCGKSGGNPALIPVGAIVASYLLICLVTRVCQNNRESYSFHEFLLA